MLDFDFLLGHKPLGRRPNIREEIKRIRRDPLLPLLEELGYDGIHVVSDDMTRYVESYWFYVLSMERYLREMSVAARYSRGPRWVRKSGGTEKYTPAQRKLADEYNQIGKFLELDITNCVIHTRILLDRVVSITRRFLTADRQPSYTSFSNHKKFFLKLTEPFGQHEAYAKYIREETDWFEMPIKAVRDKFIIHSAPKHLRFLGYPSGGYELDLNITLPDAPEGNKTFSKVKMIRINALRMSYDVETFLNWLNNYGLAALKNAT